MADNTPQAGSATIATDEVTLLNGAASSGVHVQRVKLTQGPDGTATDVAQTTPLFVQDSDLQASGSITVADTGSTTTPGSPTTATTVNRVTGTPTPGSSVVLAVTGESSFSIDVSGTWTGTLVLERTVDGITWTDITAFIAGTPYQTRTFIGNGAFHGNASAASQIRVRATALTTGTAIVTIRSGAGTGTITVGNPLRELHDSGRVPVCLLIDNVAAPATEALLSYGGSNGATALTAGTAAFTVPTGRVFRVQSVQLAARGTAIDTVRARIRAATAVAATSQLYAAVAVALPANGGNAADVEPPREIEIASGQQVGISVVGATTSTLALAVMGYTYIP